MANYARFFGIICFSHCSRFSEIMLFLMLKLSFYARFNAVYAIMLIVNVQSAVKVSQACGHSLLTHAVLQGNDARAASSFL